MLRASIPFLLTPDTAARHLADRLGADVVGAAVEALGGGISSIVLRVVSPAGSWVLKQPRRRFRVAQTWEVEERRAEVEARFARLVRQRVGPVVPEVLDYDAGSFVLVMEDAGPRWAPWKLRLLKDDVEPDLGAQAGELLAKIHVLDAQGLDEPELFAQQRLQPYFAAAAALHPVVAARLRALGDRLAADKTALVHGDFSPKNLLTDGTSLRLVDHEVATCTDPRFDVAFLGSHLLLKAFRGVDAQRCVDVWDEFAYRYRRARGPAPIDARLSELLAALLLARVDGKSPVEYLSSIQKEKVRLFALQALHAPPQEPDALVGAAVAAIRA